MNCKSWQILGRKNMHLPLFLHKYSLFSLCHGFCSWKPNNVGRTLSFSWLVHENSWFPLTERPEGPTTVPWCLFKGRRLEIGLEADSYLRVSRIQAVCVFVCFCRWPCVPSDAPSSAALYEEPQQRDSHPPKEQCHSLGSWGHLHPLLLHALPPPGVGKSQRGALQGYLTDREVRTNRTRFQISENLLNKRLNRRLFTVEKTFSGDFMEKLVFWTFCFWM